jgi:5-methylcytosine-specific restriction endonuclease McrA
MAIALRSQKFEKLDPVKKTAHGRIYKNQKVKDNIIDQWELHTGQKWPVYAQDVLKKDGTVLFPAGSKVQAHHIIHQSHGGPHTWWNIHPLHTGQHQKGVHKSGAPGEILHDK